jgi:DNA-binding TFAR19-related protein (PDSD5 family)
MSQENQEEEKALIQQIALLENIAKRNMSREAISRYGNLKLAHPETAVRAIATIAQAVQSGHISSQITDSQFKEILLEMQQGNIKQIRFRK